MVKKFFKLKLVVLITLLVLAVTFANIVVGYLFLPGPLTKKEVVIIKKGLSTYKISKILEEKGVINNSFLFEILAKIYSKHSTLKSGEYKFTKNITPYQVLKVLSSGKSIVNRLFFPEGMTVKMIIDKINNNDKLIGKINGYIPEGYLMPSTYFYSYGDQRNMIVEAMRSNMSKTLDKYMPLLSKKSPLKTRKDVLIMASIIEKEAGNNIEKPIISSVFMNRLRKGMKLQTDPTVIYAITEGQSALGRSLKKSDLKVDSPYNTYKNYGLPPGAISCPGEKSIKAAVNPARTKYLYFVANGMGGHNFSSTLEEHNKYVRVYKDFLKRKTKMRK